jgi:hypothetical protein
LSRRAIAALAILAATMVLTACNGVSFVERILLVNETEYSANVDVRGEGGGWLGLGTVSANETREVGDVIDQGPTWTFRFSYGGHDPVEVTVGKQELIEAGWRVEVPEELEENLRAEGVPPPP